MKEISFVIIAYNEQRTITNCIRSILNQGELTNYDYKIIVVNDGSKDETSSVVENVIKNNPRIQLIH
ncbi:MAG TPA: glycosyltransferase, partial [Patescibacteria group bacterium]|nr:glycosyltransferase [Patescibacteria group bacterium]